MSTKILDRMTKKYERLMRKGGFEPTEVSVLEVMELDRQAHLAQELFERLLEEGRRDQAEQVGWLLWFKHGIDVGLFDKWETNG